MKKNDLNESFTINQQEEISLLPKNVLLEIQSEEDLEEVSKIQEEKFHNHVNIL